MTAAKEEESAKELGKAKQEVEEARAKEPRARAAEEKAAKVAAAKAY